MVFMVGFYYGTEKPRRYYQILLIEILLDISCDIINSSPNNINDSDNESSDSYIDDTDKDPS